MELHRRDDGYELIGRLKFKDVSEIAAFCKHILRYPTLTVSITGDASLVRSPLTIDDERDEVSA